LIRNGFITLDDVNDSDWFIMNALLQEEQEYKRIQEEHNKAVKELLS